MCDTEALIRNTEKCYTYYVWKRGKSIWKNKFISPLMEGGYEGVFKSLTKEKQSELIGRKAAFARAAGISL